MYLVFLKALVAYIEAINAVCATIDEKDGLTPYLDRVPVLLDGELCGYLQDEVGGEYTYLPAEENDRAWWDNRPWKH